jgi:sarcosine oxidase subunit beta
MADVVIIGGGCMGAKRRLSDSSESPTSCCSSATPARHRVDRAKRGWRQASVLPRATFALSVESIQLLEHFADTVGHPADLHQDGYLFLLNTESSVETFRRNVELQRRHGVSVAWLDARDAAGLAPGLDVGGVVAATVCQRDGIADPNGVTMGFRKRRRPGRR